MDEAEYKKQMEEVKKNCPFCKIVAGEIPSSKVYDDEKIIAVLDINPKTKGHTLVMPKEHHPILPLVPPDTFSHLFKKVKMLSKACAHGTANRYANVFVANGATAGQQAQHFLLHVIPNENTGGFDIPENKVTPDEMEKTFNIFKNNLPVMMNNHFQRNPSLKPRAPVPTEEELKNHEKTTMQNQIESPSVFANLSVDQIADTLIANQQVLEVLLRNPQEFKQLVPKHPQMSVLFTNVKVDDVILKIKEKIAAKTGGDVAVSNGVSSDFETRNDVYNNDVGNDVEGGNVSGGEPVITPTSDVEEVVNIVMGNNLVRDAMLQDVEKFKTLVPQNESLSKLFSNISVDEVYTIVKQRVGQ